MAEDKKTAQQTLSKPEAGTPASGSTSLDGGRQAAKKK